MLERMTIIDRLEIVAERGDTNAALKLWGAQISKLEKRWVYSYKNCAHSSRR